MGFFDFFKRSAKEKTDAAVPDDPVHVLTLLSPDDIQWLNGIPPQGMLAAYKGPEFPALLFGNPPFVEMLHDVIRRRAPQDLELQAAARQQGDGYLYIVDAKTPNGVMGDVPPEDIIGAFTVTEGEVVPDSYQANSNYAVFRRERGLVRLPGALHDALLEELRALPPATPSAG